MNMLLPHFSVPVNVLSEEGNLDPKSLFVEKFKSLRLEIGFGNGEHLAALLRNYKDIGFFGAEPFINGMAGFLKDISEESPPNIRVLMDDAMLLVKSFMDGSLEKIYVLNPDPWPKKRHHKRRIINESNLDQFARVLQEGGELIMATDVDELGEWMNDQCSQHKHFVLKSKTQPQEWIETRYAFKGKQAGRAQSFLTFIKK